MVKRGSTSATPRRAASRWSRLWSSSDSIPAFRAAAVAALADRRPLTLEALEAQQAQLEERRRRYGGLEDALDIWSAQGIVDPERLPLLEAEQFLVAVQHRELP